MRPPLLLLCLVLIGCPTTDQPEALEAIEGTVNCDDGGDRPIWDFALAVRGPADEAGAEMRIFSDDVPNEFAYSLVFDGANGTARADYSFSRDGTLLGEDPSPGNIPFACEEFDAVHVLFCARNSFTLDTTCWACDEDPGADLPSGADAWMSCS